MKNEKKKLREIKKQQSRWKRECEEGELEAGG